jgi:hypothetical protein
VLTGALMLSLRSTATLRPSLVAVALAVVLSLAPTVAPAQQVNILALGEDAQPRAVRRDNRVFARVVTALNDVLSRSEFRVYDETAVTADFTSPTRTLRRDFELVDIARAITQPPIDALLIFDIQASASRPADGSWPVPRVVITGRIIHVQTGQLFARFESGANARLDAINPGCVRECFIDRIGDQARPIAAELAEELTRRLATFVRPPRVREAAPPAPAQPDCGPRQVIEVELTGYPPADLPRVERYLAAFGCYLRHRVIGLEDQRQSIWLETGLPPARVAEDMAAAAGFWPTPGTVALDDRRIRVQARRSPAPPAAPAIDRPSGP